MKEGQASRQRRKRRNGTRAGLDNFTNAVVSPVSDKEVAAAVESYAPRKPKLGAGSGAAVSAKAHGTVSRHGGDDAERIHFANAEIILVGDEEVATPVYSNSNRTTELGHDGQATVTTESKCPVTCYGGDDAERIYFADTVVAKVGDKYIASLINSYAGRSI